MLFACHGECPKNRLMGEAQLMGEARLMGEAQLAGEDRLTGEDRPTSVHLPAGTDPMAGPVDGPKVNYLCRGYRHFFTAIDAPMRYLAACVLSGRDPARVMPWARQHRILVSPGT